jgi:hypothetical protein
VRLSGLINEVYIPVNISLFDILSKKGLEVGFELQSLVVAPGPLLIVVFIVRAADSVNDQLCVGHRFAGQNFVRSIPLKRA